MVNIDKNNYQIPQSHNEELDRRIEKIESGKETFFIWAEVKKHIQKSKINNAHEQIKNGEFLTEEQADMEYEKWVKN